MIHVGISSMRKSDDGRLRHIRQGVSNERHRPPSFRLHAFGAAGFANVTLASQQLTDVRADSGASFARLGSDQLACLLAPFGPPYPRWSARVGVNTQAFLFRPRLLVKVVLRMLPR